MAHRKNGRTNTDQHATSARMNKRLTDIENRFESESGKASVGDYVRLLQVERELDEADVPLEIEVS